MEIWRGGIRLGRRFGSGGAADLLVGFQPAEAAIDGALDGGLIAGEIGEGVGTGTIDVEGAGEEVSGIGCGRRGRGGVAVGGAVLLVLGVEPLAAGILFGYGHEALAVDAGFEGKRATEAPFVGGDTEDQSFLGFADGLEAIDVILQQEEELGGFVVGEDMFVGAQTVHQAIAAGFIFAFRCTGAGGFLCVTAIGLDFSVAGGAGGARFGGIFHSCLGARRCRSFRLHANRRGAGDLMVLRANL
jgi:hypothetical protein